LLEKQCSNAHPQPAVRLLISLSSPLAEKIIRPPPPLGVRGSVFLLSFPRLFLNPGGTGKTEKKNEVKETLKVNDEN
jgi:hypothetical protein